MPVSVELSAEIVLQISLVVKDAANRFPYNAR